MDPNPDGYTFFPVYRFYDRANQGIRSITAQSLADGRFMNPVIPGQGNIPVVHFDATPSGFFSPFATLIIANESSEAVFLTMRGATRLTSQNGQRALNPGNHTFELNLEKQPKLPIGGLSFDPNKGAAQIVNIPEYTYEAEYTYRVSFRPGAVPSVTRLQKADTSSLTIPLLNE